jgi:hypothetical protein
MYIDSRTAQHQFGYNGMLAHKQQPFAPKWNILVEFICAFKVLISNSSAIKGGFCIDRLRINITIILTLPSL